jgi:hypothetical protein
MIPGIERAEPKRTGRRFAMAIAALTVGLIALLAAGCGGDDETASATDGTAALPSGELSKEALASAADGLCTETNQEILDEVDPPDFGDDGPQASELPDSVPYWQTTAEKGQELVDQLSDLQPPEDLQQQYDEFLKLMEKENVDYANALEGYAADSDLKGLFGAAQKFQAELVELPGTAQRLGMSVCGANEAQQQSSS